MDNARLGPLSGEHGGYSSPFLRLVACTDFVLALLFVHFFNLTKHDPILARLNPFAEDPYDGVGSFGIQLAVLCAVCSSIRAFCPTQADESFLSRYVFVLRAIALSLCAVIVTVLADMTAMIRFHSMWVGFSGGRNLIALVVGLFMLALLLCLYVLRHAKRMGLFSPLQSWPLSVVLCLCSLFLLGMYPQTWRQGIPGAILTAATGMVSLFLIVALLAKTMFPHTDSPEKDLLDDIVTIYKWLKDCLGSAARPLVWIEKRVNATLVRKIAVSLNPRKHVWRLLAFVAVLMGITMALAEVVGEGLSPDRSKALLVVTVFVTLEGAGVLLGYVLFRRFLGIFRIE